jgi:putative ABC transport system permease protein
MNITLLRGRGFTSSDGASKPSVALINEAFVKQFFAKGDVIGKHVTVALNPSSDQAIAEIVGVVVNVADYQGQSSFQPQIYLPYAQYPDAHLTLLAGTSTNPKGVISALREAIWSVDKNQPIDNPRTMNQVITNTNGGNRLMIILLEIFAILAPLLVAIGIYGVIASTVSQRNREIGIRLALGAHRRDILLMVLKNGLKLAVIGLLIGLPLSAPIPHLLGRVFHEIFAIHTLAVLIGVPVFVALVAIVATFMPALRASRVDPIHALRYE